MPPRSPEKHFIIHQTETHLLMGNNIAVLELDRLIKKLNQAEFTAGAFQTKIIRDCIHSLHINIQPLWNYDLKACIKSIEKRSNGKTFIQYSKMTAIRLAGEYQTTHNLRGIAGRLSDSGHIVEYQNLLTIVKMIETVYQTIELQRCAILQELWEAVELARPFQLQSESMQELRSAYFNEIISPT